MAKVIIGIHGLGNKPSKEILQSWWEKAMMEGLQKVGKQYSFPKFELVYWSDILYDKPMDTLINDTNDPYYLEEKYTPGQPNIVAENNSIRQKILDILETQLDKLFLNDDLTINYKGITDVFINRYFKDLEIYYAEVCTDKNDLRCMARQLIRERLAEVITKYKDDEIIIVGHSMGSIVAYDVLTFLVPEINIHTFITIGSPLGFPVIQGKIASEWHDKRLGSPKLKTPPGVNKNWYNFADLRDKVALIYNLRENYEANWQGIAPKDFVVNNDYIINDEANHHKSFGYLRTPQFAEVLYNFSAKENFARRIIARINSLIKK